MSRVLHLPTRCRIFPGETGAKGMALMSPQSEGVDGCCRRNQRAIHTANRPVYILQRASMGIALSLPSLRDGSRLVNI